ncbi:Gag protein [Phytophthora palmivora]|uniref:Gag protein n=1 Tax=Phytophthora palmivora TaxID=4796 RepID=A0A2P4X4S7_9STRA|nr:Gag protein [Phytophthora palmivora]
MDRGEFPRLADAPFESVWKMVSIFGEDTLRSLAAATPAEQVERIEAFDMAYRSRAGAAGPVAERKPAQPKPLRLKVNPYEGKVEENLHYWAREVELAMGAALVSTERLRVAFTYPTWETWAYTREATTPGCFTTWAQLCQQLRAAFLPVNYEYRQRSCFLACKLGKRELHEYIQEMRVLAASLVGNPHIKVTVFMDGLKVGPSRTQLFRVHANTMEEAIQIALQEEYSHRQARNPTSSFTPATPTYRVGITAFKAFVNSEHVAFDSVKQCIEQDATGKCFVFVLDKFGIHLAFNEGKKG